MWSEEYMLGYMSGLMKAQILIYRQEAKNNLLSTHYEDMVSIINEELTRAERQLEKDRQ